MRSQSQTVAAPEAAAVLAKAVSRAAAQLGIPNVALGRILGLSQATVTRLHQGSYRLEPDSKPGELALLLVRLFRSLDSITGGQEAARAWLDGDNAGLNGRPRDLILSPRGLVHVTDYLDAHRARV
ncbi:antitoxin Xre-like helix-turn-helix domain-containing protein [Arenimonas sp.]|uniref:antitoxin Xre-like helix-turn-helix domain-containing protein n=1 Tax=Arenimonas sp. TaxID=1872635 RepID=UPI0025E41A82|nr:antitoxin Xre-like helix-turn-helix domain-containing protein [Arenimonas sp.]